MVATMTQGIPRGSLGTGPCTFKNEIEKIELKVPLPQEFQVLNAALFDKFIIVVTAYLLLQVWAIYSTARKY